MKRIKPRKSERLKRKKLKRIKPRKSMDSTVQLLRQNVRAYHKTLGEKFVSRMSIRQLLAYCHPLDRSDYARKLNINFY
jgi:phenylacetate-coenzyme A ligase PaaK-like adenylate-forming protein